jgi:hypothetical protein
MGVTGLPDTPELSTEDMQAQFDEYSVFLKNKFKTHIDELEANTAAADIGMEIPISLQNNITTEKVQAIVNEIAARLQSGKNWQDAAEQLFTTLELNANTVNADEISTSTFHSDGTATTVAHPSVDDYSNKVATTKYVVDNIGRAGYGDMNKVQYDPDRDGVIAPPQGGTGYTALDDMFLSELGLTVVNGELCQVYTVL